MSEGGVSPVPREARPYQGQRAGVVTRLVSALIDSVLASLGLGAAYAALTALLFILDPKGFSFPSPSLVFTVAGYLALLAAYLTVGWTASGRTYGCLVMGLRVVGPRGRKLRLPGALVRACLYTIFPVGLFWCAVNRENRSLQDLLLRTSVVYDWQPRIPREAQ